MKELNNIPFFNRIQVMLGLAVSILMIFIISIISLLLYLASDRVLEENTVDSSQKIIGQVNYDIEYYLKNVETTIDGLFGSVDVKEYFKEPNREKKEVAVSYINSLIQNRDDIINVFMITPDGKLISNDLHSVIKENVNFLEEKYYWSAVESEQMQVSGSHVQNVHIGQYEWVVSCSRRFVDKEGKFLGIIVVDLNFHLIQELLSPIALGERGYVFIVDANGEIIYHPKRDLIYSGLKDEPIGSLIEMEKKVHTDIVEDEDVIYILEKSVFSDWWVIGKSYHSDLNRYRKPIQRYSIYMALIGLLIAVFFSSIIAGRILRPVKKLLIGIDEFQHGNLDIEVPVETQNELGYLTLAFNQMTKRIARLIDENKKAERNKRKSELAALQSQINPHFLYNTLDSIIWMAEMNRNQDVVKMTAALAKLFRISISKGKEFITLEEEIEHVENYLLIQKVRYGEKLMYHLDVEEEIRHEKIIKILIQPIIENAIYHGIKSVPGQGEILIRAGKKMRNNQMQLQIEIEDNGIGMEEETIQALLNGTIKTTGRGNNVGVHNVHQRIKLYYGEEYGIEIDSELYEGTIVKLWLPLEWGEQYEKN